MKSITIVKQYMEVLKTAIEGVVIIELKIPEDISLRVSLSMNSKRGYVRSILCRMTNQSPLMVR